MCSFHLENVFQTKNTPFDIFSLGLQQSSLTYKRMNIWGESFHSICLEMFSVLFESFRKKLMYTFNLIRILDDQALSIPMMRSDILWSRLWYVRVRSDYLTVGLVQWSDLNIIHWDENIRLFRDFRTKLLIVQLSEWKKKERIKERNWLRDI